MFLASKPRGHWALHLINLVFLVLVSAMLLWGFNHRSGRPDVLGQYSVGYAAFLAALALVVLLQLWLLCCAGERLRSWAANLYTLVVSSLLVVGLTEVLLRVFNPWGMDFFHHLPYHMQGMLDDSQLGYAHPRGVNYRLGGTQVSINSRGLRDHETPYAKAPGQRRVLVLGDSVAFGWGVAQGETFSDQMEPLLEQRTGQYWEVINSGVNGYNTQQEQIWLEVEGLRYEPDIVVLVYVANDTDPVFDPNANTWRRYPQWPPSLPEALNRLRQLSYLFQGAQVFTRLSPAAVNDAEPKAPHDKPSITDKPRWPQSKQALTTIARTLDERGIRFLVARNSGTDPRFFVELEASGIDGITLNPAWSRVPSELAHVSRVDSHPSALVHAEMAILLVDELDQRGWLGTRHRATP